MLIFNFKNCIKILKIELFNNDDNNNEKFHTIECIHFINFLAILLSLARFDLTCKFMLI